MTVLEVTNIHKSYGKTTALDGVSFDVPEGSIFGILGPNGSGKTTLLGIIMDVLKADKGTYRWFGDSNSSGQRKRIGTLLETPNFYHYLSATRNLDITRRISGRGTKEEIDKVLQEINLFKRKNSPFSSYSLGMKQRLAIGSALLGSPSVLVLDEPTNGLDPVGIAEIRQLIADLNAKGHTIIIASHLLDEVEKICSHVSIMKQGRLLACGAVNEVLREEDVVEVSSDDNAQLAEVAGLCPRLLIQKPEKDKILLTFEKGKVDLSDINSFFFSKGIVLNHLNLRKQRLEARFFELTNN